MTAAVLVVVLLAVGAPGPGVEGARVVGASPTNGGSVAGAVAAVAVLTEQDAFPDVRTTHPFWAEIMWAVEHGITTGYVDGLFHPASQLSRQALVAWLYRLAGSPKVTVPTPTTFSDDPAGHPFVDEVEWAVAVGITNGYPDGTFRPAASITRQALVTLLHRLAGSPAVVLPATPTFPDVPSTHVFAGPIEWAAGLGIVQGFADGRFSPQAPVSRMASSAFLYRYRHLVWSPARQLSHAEVDEYLGDLVSAADADGHIHVLWKEDDVLLYRKVDAAGNTLVRTVQLPVGPVSSRAYSLSHPALAPLPDGGVAVFWRYGVAVGSGPGIYGARLDASGRVVTEARLLRAGHFAYLTAGADTGGRIQLVAQQVRATTSSSSTIIDQIVHVTLDDALDPLTPWTPLTDRQTSNAATYPQLAVGPDGTTHVVWFDNRRNPGTIEWDVYYSRIDPDGVVAIDQLALAEVNDVFHNDGDPPGTWGPAVDVDPDGDVAVAYLGDFREVYLATIDADGTPGLRGTALSMGAFSTSARNRGVDVRAERRAVTVLAPSGGALAKLVAVRADLTGTVVSPAREVPLGPDGWVRASLTHVGGGLQAVLMHDLGSTFDRVVFTATTAAEQRTDLPDLLVDDAHSANVSTPAPPREGTDVDVSVEVANAGWVAAPATSATVAYDGTPVASVPVPALAVEETATVTATWTVPEAIDIDPALLDVVVDPLATIEETTEDNNQTLHQVDLWLRPAGVRFAVKGVDETEDPAREGFEPVTGFDLTVTGTTTEGAPLTVTGDADLYAHLGYPDSPIPPGTYTVTATKAGYADPAPVPLTIVRDPVDPYVITVDPPTPTMWFNRWGGIAGTVVAVGSGTPIEGAVVTEREQGRSATTGPDGTFQFDHLAAGTHHLSVEADDRARIIDQQVEVPIGSPQPLVMPMDSTPLAYLDVVTSSDLGGAVRLATVELLDATGTTVVATCQTDDAGRCSFTPPGATSYRLRASHVGYTTSTTEPFETVAGRSRTEEVVLPLVVGDTTGVSSGLMAWSAWADQFSVPFGADELLFYGNHATTIGIEYQDVGVDRYLRSLEVELKGNPWSLQILMDVPQTGGPWPMPFLLVIPSVSEERTNVRLDGVRIVNRVTREVYWTAPPESVGEPPYLYSHTLEGEANGRSWLLDEPVDWNNVVIELDVGIGIATPGVEGAGGWVGSTLLYGPSELSTITWSPATGEETISGRRS